MSATPSYLPDLHLAGLSIDDVIDLHTYLRRIIPTLETDKLGAPFTAKIAGRTDAFDDTHIGAVVTSIYYWAVKQEREVIKHLALCKPTSPDDADLRGSILMEDIITLGDWNASSRLFALLHEESRAIKERARS